MDILIKIEGDALDSFLRFVEKAQNAGCHRLRIAVDGEQLKVKANEYTWTAPMGEVATGDDAR